MEKVAVTGHTGFIGKHLVKGLEEAGYEVIRVDRNFTPVECSRIYHLACPSTTEFTVNHTLEVMDIILDLTRKALKICPTAKFINASSVGAAELVSGPQGAYNIAKRCMEHYLQQTGRDILNYRLPAVYGEGMHDDFFIKKCIDGRATPPTDPNRPYFIAHVNEVVDAMVKVKHFKVENITLGEIYEQFNSGRRGLHRPTSNP